MKKSGVAREDIFLSAECEIEPHVIKMEAHPYCMDTETIKEAEGFSNA